ncbi:MAG TPA: methyltransferase type 11, partial [Rhizobiales bacterium]|nr:methyltransferase type 11 [Hyphomicrobiales bacterium]
LAARLPATYAAVRASLAMIADVRPDFSPATLLDLGAGPGTVLWAAIDCWPGIGEAQLVEASTAARTAGTELARGLTGTAVAWVGEDINRTGGDLRPADLVTLSYVLDELDPATVGPLVERLWALTRDTLVVVEPGTPAGWSRIRAVRDRLIGLGAEVAAPCPHARPCPLTSPDWCHFSRRVARSRLHRQTKAGDVPWEDEKFIFVAASRRPAAAIAARLIAPPRQAKGMATLKLCRADGTAEARTVTRREGEGFRVARRLDWGDALPAEAESAADD